MGGGLFWLASKLEQWPRGYYTPYGKWVDWVEAFYWTKQYLTDRGYLGILFHLLSVYSVLRQNYMVIKGLRVSEWVSGMSEWVEWVSEWVEWVSV